MSGFKTRLLCVCFNVLLLSRAFAADSVPSNSAALSGELSLSQAIAAALKRNPELAVTSFELNAADARVLQAGVRPNPEAAVQLDNVFGTGEARGVKVLETTLSLGQVIELGGKRNSRVGVAGLSRDLVGVEREAQQLDVLADVTRRFIEVVAAQRVIALAQQATRLTEQTLAAITTRVQAARSPLAEQSRATIAVTRARIEQQQAASTLQAARRALAALWGDRVAEFSNASADLFALPTVQTYEALSASLQLSPDFLRFATDARLRDAEMRLAQAYAKPNLNVALGIRRFEATGNTALVAGVTYALPIYDRNQGTIREAQVRREQNAVRSQATLIRAEATLYGLYQELQAARNRLETLRGEAIPQAEVALAQTRNGYERGRFSYLELLSAQQELLGLESAAIQAAANYHLQLTEIERLTAEPLAN